MKYSFAALALAATGALAGWDNGTVYTTEIVTALTTYCPAATTLTHGDKTYTVSEATTLTITDCPCTVTKAISSATVAPTSAPAVSGSGSSTILYTSCPPEESGASSAPLTRSNQAPVSTSYSNPLTVVYSTGAGAKPTGTGSNSPIFTGAASANKVGAMVGAVAGFAVLAL